MFLCCNVAESISRGKNFYRRLDCSHYECKYQDPLLFKYTCIIIPASLLGLYLLFFRLLSIWLMIIRTLQIHVIVLFINEMLSFLIHTGMNLQVTSID